MISTEKLVLNNSFYYIYSPSILGRDMFFYPLSCGHFFYAPGYSLSRSSYDSFLLIYVKNGCLELLIDNEPLSVKSDSFIFLDCYKPHAYSCADSCECIWMHFDGPLARAFFNSIHSRFGSFFSIPNPYTVISKLESILECFRSSSIKEALLSKYINDILTSFLLYSPSVKNNAHSDSIDTVIAYINEHFGQPLPDTLLADIAGLSIYHFIRIFRQKTGFTPHEYLISTRLCHARYLLRNTQLSVKDICFSCGFSNESSFCTNFKKHEGITPLEYRMSDKEI